MMLQSFVFIVLLSITSQIVHSQDISFPGQTERPSRFPIIPTKPTFSPPTVNDNTRLPTQRPPVTPPVSNPAYETCFSKCLKTAEYNPVCGSDGAVYYNPSNLNCAKFCGRNTELIRFGQCDDNNTRG